LPVKSACVKAGIGVSTLADWREKYPEVEAGIERARDVFREKAFKTIRAAVDSGSWQAAVQALKLVFVEYRGEGAKIDINATAQISAFVITEPERLRLIEARRKLALDRNQAAILPRNDD